MRKNTELVRFRSVSFVYGEKNDNHYENESMYASYKLFSNIMVQMIHTLIFIMTVFFFHDKKNSSSNSGAKTHRFGLCSQRSVSI